jgi:DNA-binding MarR family transcriptional regulator
MLTEIIKLLKERGSMSLADLARHFQTDISVMQDMLEILERKQRIERLDTKCSRCKGCTEVKPEDAVIFRCLEKG